MMDDQLQNKIRWKSIIILQSKKMNQGDRYLTLRDENRQSQQGTAFRLTKNVKFRSLKKQPLSKIHHQSSYHKYKKCVNDREAMSYTIQHLRQQNNHLKLLTKMQKTQLTYTFEQQKQLLKSNMNENTMEKDNKFKNGNYQKRLQLQNYGLKKEIKRLQEQNIKIKRTTKNTNIKELSTTIEVYEQEIKKLFSKLIVYEKQTRTVEDINKIISKQYYAEIKNKQLKSVLQQKNQQLEESSKNIKKLKNLIFIKNQEIEKYKRQKQYALNCKKNKLMDQYVHKNQLMVTKKEMATMAQTIEKLYLAMNEYEIRIQFLRQQNIDNLSKEMGKRSQLILQLQRVKQNNQNLQYALEKCKKSQLSTIIPEFKFRKMEAEIRKLKNPLVVNLQHIKQAIECLIHSLQTNHIPYEQAINLILSCDHRLKLDQGQIPSQEQFKNFMINIRQVIFCLELPPISMENFDQKQLLARYMVESEADAEKKYMDYDDVLANINYSRSVFKQILGEYPLFTASQISEHCFEVQQFIRKYESILKTSLSKMHPSSKTNYLSTLQNSADLTQIKEMKSVYPCKEYLQAITKQNQLNLRTIQFIKFWIYKVKQNYYTIDEFVSLFKSQGAFTFITQDKNVVQENEENDEDIPNVGNISKISSLKMNELELSQTEQHQ